MAGLLQTTYHSWGLLCTLDNNFKLRRKTLSFELLPNAHTADNLTDSVWAILKSYNILDKIYAITGDSALNNMRMAKNLESNWNRRYFTAPQHRWNAGTQFINCTAHVIHNAVIQFLLKMLACPADDYRQFDRTEEEGTRLAGGQQRRYPKIQCLEGFAKTLEKLRMVATASSNSTVRKEQFQEHVKRQLGKALLLKVDVRTRWHSTAAMLQRALLLKGPISAWIVQRNELDELTMDGQEWAEAELIYSILRPFCTCAQQLVTTATINIHLTYGIYNYLFEHLEAFKERLEDEFTVQSCYKEQLLVGLDAAWNLLNKYYRLSDPKCTYSAAILLNPSIKGKYFTGEEWKLPADNVPWQEKYEQQLVDTFKTFYHNRDKYDNTQPASNTNNTMSYPSTPVRLGHANEMPTPSRKNNGTKLFFAVAADVEQDSLDTQPEKEVLDYLKNHGLHHNCARQHIYSTTGNPKKQCGQTFVC
ncbi:protein of unknown function [Taphrina deformans PYCC 5710]|uniref:Uncharacterized protein n=1 Tax=Taphrina deformans (strain PYCC 5710 / ATCC 11124 / CBS 356.35 / IMI 108563 / JCM 9778 / NBRC 8474) TaxID=1097556 RepID=R4XNX9_TAPDE|nr:protein of unknown function [Taphrina deformans PYCC 5710]|eukprot:CCG84965.1 protein of unknown function [Taphrina deformans PYCC 5710]